MANSLNNSVLLPPPFLVGLIRRRTMMKALAKPIGTLIYAAEMPASGVRSIDVYRYDTAMGAFECSDISDLASSVNNVYAIPKNDSIGVLINYGNIRGTLTKVDNTHFTFQNQRTEQDRAANTRCVITSVLTIPIGLRNTEAIEYRLEFEGYCKADAYYRGGPYSQYIETATSAQPSGGSNKAYKCKKTVWFSVKWTGNNFAVTTHKAVQKVWKVADVPFVDEGEYADERTLTSFGTGDVSPHIFIECLGAVTAKLYQL